MKAGGEEGEAQSDYRLNPDGVRVKHKLHTNSVNAYDKAGSVLRIETRINRRYSEALGSLDTTTAAGQLAAPICRPVRRKGVRYRGLRPWSEEDCPLLEVKNQRRYHLTPKGREILSAILAAQHASLQQLNALAA